MNPTISIIVPAYQAEATIERLIESIVSQTYSNWELLIIDDGSSDRTFELIEKWVQKDNRIHIIQQNNRGVSAARNRGIVKSNGDWLFFADADDYLPNDSLKILIENSHSSDLICGGYDSPTIRCKSNKEVAQWDSAELLKMIVNPSRYRSIPRTTTNFNELFERSPWGKLYRASIIRQEKIFFDESINFGEDTLFNIQFLSHASKVATINDSTYYYDFESSTITRYFSQADVKKIIDVSPHILKLLSPLVKHGDIDLDDAQFFVSDIALRIFRRAAREASNLNEASKSINLIGQDPLLRKSLASFHRPSFVGEIINRLYIVLIKHKLSLIALRIERSLTKQKAKNLE